MQTRLDATALALPAPGVAFPDLHARAFAAMVPVPRGVMAAPGEAVRMDIATPLHPTRRIRSGSRPPLDGCSQSPLMKAATEETQMAVCGCRRRGRWLLLHIDPFPAGRAVPGKGLA